MNPRIPNWLSVLSIGVMVISCAGEIDTTDTVPESTIAVVDTSRTIILIADDELKESRGLVPSSRIIRREDIPTWDTQVSAAAIMEDVAFDIDRYYRHYTALSDHSGKQFILVYGACSGPRDEWWSLFQVRDGGRCYFQAWIDIDKNQVVRFFFHGEA